MGGTYSVLACRLHYYTTYPAYLGCYLDAKTIFPLSHPTRKLCRGALLFSMLSYICSRVVQIKLHSQFFRAYNLERIIMIVITHYLNYSISSYRLCWFTSLVFVVHMLPAVTWSSTMYNNLEDKIKNSMRPKSSLVMDCAVKLYYGSWEVPPFLCRLFS